MYDAIAAQACEPLKSFCGTIEKLLAVLRRSAMHKPFKMVVKYDSALGYPVQADLDPKRYAKDDELFFRVTAFKPLREAGAGVALTSFLLDDASQRHGSAPGR